MRNIKETNRLSRALWYALSTLERLEESLRYADPASSQFVKDHTALNLLCELYIRQRIINNQSQFHKNFLISVNKYYIFPTRLEKIFKNIYTRLGEMPGQEAVLERLNYMNANNISPDIWILETYGAKALGEVSYD